MSLLYLVSLEAKRDRKRGNKPIASHEWPSNQPCPHWIDLELNAGHAVHKSGQTREKQSKVQLCSTGNKRWLQYEIRPPTKRHVICRQDNNKSKKGFLLTLRQRFHQQHPP